MNTMTNTSILIPEQLLVNLAVWYAAGYQYRYWFDERTYHPDFLRPCKPSGERL